jgi:hypothetical protein
MACRQQAKSVRMDRVDDLAAAVAASALPTPRHAEAALALGRLFAADPDLSAVLLGGSLARGRGHATSDLDLLLLVAADRLVAFRDRPRPYADLGAVTSSAEPDGVTLDLGGLPAHIWMTAGELAPAASGQVLDDPFELEIAALYVNARPLLDRDGLRGRLGARYLPFYAEGLRQQRLQRLAGELAGHCEAVERLADRNLGFAALDRLHTAFRAFVLGLFLANRHYPLDLMKHLEEQVSDGLRRPDLLPAMRGVLSLRALAPAALAERAHRLRSLWRDEVGAG